jgi:choline dehydrogenase
MLLEAGDAPDDLAVRQPGQWTSLLGGRWDWAYATQPDDALGGRRIAWPRGKGIGGSSLIHAMAHLRGHRLDFDGWSALGNPGWDYASVLPFFIRSERNERGPSPFHGADGPLHVGDTRDPSDAHVAFLSAAAELGHASRADWDFNGAQQEGGAGFYQKTIRNGLRHSVADAYLGPAGARANLTVRPGAQATRLLFDRRRVVGVEFASGGRLQRVRAEREVVVCAGVIESPKLLMLSGIGHADALRRLGLPVVADVPGVGRNLQDHPRITVAYRALRDIRGSSASAGLFLRSSGRPASASPDIELFFGRGLSAPSQTLAVAFAFTQPQSRGSIELASADPLAPPLIRAGYFDSPADMAAMVEGIAIARALAHAKALAPWRGSALDPGHEASSPTDLAAFVRRSSETFFHPAGTCRMGGDGSAVVDHELRVRGVDGLRVADASIMPVVVNAPLNAACVMIGERAAASIAAGRDWSP